MLVISILSRLTLTFENHHLGFNPFTTNSLILKSSDYAMAYHCIIAV